MSFDEALFIQLRQDLGILFVQGDANSIKVRVTSATPEKITGGGKYRYMPCEVVEESKIRLEEFYRAARKLFRHLRVEKFLMSQEQPGTLSHDFPWWCDPVTVFVRGLMEVCCGLCPEISDYHVNCAYRHRENVARERLIVLNRENINYVISSLERLEEISLSFFSFFSILADCLSDGTFRLINVLPVRVIEKVKVKDKDIFYFYPQPVSLLEKRYPGNQLLELAHEAREICILPFFDLPVSEKVLKIFSQPEDVFELMQKASTGGLAIDLTVTSNRVQVKSETRFSWTLLYVFSRIAEHLIKARKNESDSTLEEVVRYCAVSTSSEEVKSILQDAVNIYRKYIRKVETHENLSRVEKEIIVTATQMKLLDVINSRELNLVFISRLKTVLERDEDKTLTAEVANLISSSRAFRISTGVMLASLEKEDLSLVEKLFSLFQNTSLPDTLFLFYPQVRELEFYEKIANSTATSKRKALDYYTTYERVCERIDQQKRKALEEIKSDVEERIKPGVALYLAKMGFSSDKIVEKSKIFALSNEKNREIYLKAECFNLCKTKSFEGVAKRLLEHFFEDRYFFSVRDLIYLGKRMAEVFDDEEFRAVTEFLEIVLSGHENYVCTNVTDKAISQFWQEIKPQKFISALKKVIAEPEEKEKE